MPTLNDVPSAVAVNEVEAAAHQRSRRILGVSLGATLMTVVVLFTAMAFAPVDASAANTCTLTSSFPTTNWNDTTRWSGCGGGYPGQSAAGDTAVVTLGGFTLNVNVAANPVSLQLSGAASSIPITVASGGTLTLENSSTATSNNTFTILSGGTMGTASGATLPGYQGNVQVNGGTFNSAGTIGFSNTFTFSGGTLSGSGPVTMSNGVFNGAVGAMSINGAVINSNFISYTSPTNALTLSGGGTINVPGGGTFQVATDLAINGTASESINVVSGGTLSKTSGTALNVISCFVKNDGTVTVAGAGAGGGFGLSGSGTHTGTFTTGASSQTITFGGSNTFSAGTSFGGPTAIKFAGGTQTFNAATNANSGIKWSGGTIAGTGPLNVFGTSSLDGGISAMTLTGVINNSGTMTYAPAFAALLSINGATARLETAAPGTFTIAGDFDIQAVPAGAGTLRITASTATLTKSSGAAGSSILAFVDNAGGIVSNSSSGALNFAGGGKSTGTMSVPAGTSIMNFTNGTFDSTGAFTGSGTFNIAGGTLNVNTATTFNGAPSLNISSGTLGGTGNVIFTGTPTWSGGTITGSGLLTVTNPGLLTLTGSAGAMTLDGRTLTNNNTLLYSSSTNDLTLKNGASIVNAGTFTAAGTGTIDTDGSAVSITNNNQFTKTLSGLFLIKPAFNAAGSGVSITGGVLVIDATGTSSAPWTMSAGTEVWFPTPFSGTYTLASGTTFAGGKVTIDGSGTVATSFPMTINNTNFEVNGGTFSTPSTFTVTTPGTLKWKGGTLAGIGHTVISGSTSFDMASEAAARSVSTHIIDNNGTATLVSSAQPVSLDSGSTFNNNGNLDIQADGFLLTNGVGTNAFNNAGNVKKSAGGSGFRFDPQYNQSVGTTDANSASSGSTIIFAGGGTFFGGTLKATQATNNIDFFNGAYSLTGATLNGGAPGPIRINGSLATVNVNAPTATTSFVQNTGTLQGTADLTVSSGGTFTWNGGTMAGNGQLVVASGGTLDVTGTNVSSLTLSSHVINNSGTITYHPLTGGTINQLTLTGTASILNQSGALINTVDNSSFLQSGGGTSIVNSGNFQTSGSSSVAPTITNNPTGLIKPSGGSLSLLSGTSNGTLDAISPAAINFGVGSTFTITGGTWGGSGGGFWVTGGTVTISAPFSLSGLALNSGQINGNSTLTLTGSNAWGGGTMAGSGTTTNSGTLTMSNNLLSILDTRTFNNNATVNYQNLGNALQLKNGAVFNNSSIFDFQGDANFLCNCAVPGLFHNLGSGVLKKTSGTGASIFTAPLGNDGAVQINAGTMTFTAAGTQTGSFTPASGASIEFDAGNTFNAPSSLTGAGNIAFSSGTSTINSGTVTPGMFTVDGANVTLNSAATIGTLNVHNAAALGGSGTINLTAASPVSDWTGGTINGSGTLTVNPGANFQIDGLTAGMTLDARPLVNNGTLSYVSSTNGLVLANGAVITNSNASTFNLDAIPGIGVSGSGNTISNSGTLQRITPGSEGIAPSVTSTGFINANGGQLAFNGGLTQSSGAINLLGGSISSPSTIALAGGSLKGNGTVGAAVNNSGGIVAPGNPSTAGAISILGLYSQGPAAGMALKIGGTANHDIVDATGSGAALDGTLTVSLLGAFTPANGDTFDVIHLSTHTGDFANYFLPTWSGGGSLQSAFVTGTPNALRLTAVVTQNDLGITQIAPPSVLHGQNGTWTLTITNGPIAATNVVVTDIFANATFVSATSVGPCTPAGPTVTCNLGSLSANQSVNVTLVLNANALVSISNSASVIATEFDPNTSNNNVGPAFTPVFPAADLSLGMTASSNPVNAGTSLSFNLAVSNAGPNATSGSVSISNTFPSGVTSFTFSGAGWACSALAGSVATCTNAASIAASGSAPPLVLSMTAPATGPAVDSASVSAGTGDPNSGNNIASQSVTVTPQANLSITKTGPASVNAGQNIIYTVTVTNSGPSSAFGVSVTDPTPSGLTFVSNSGGCTGAYPCLLGTLTNGQTVTILSTYATSSASAGSTVVNSASVSSVTADPVPAGNTASFTTTVNGSADLAITKNGPVSSSPGTPLVYTITVTNNGPSDAAAVVVTDPTPVGTTFVSNAGACTTPFPCSLGTMTAGQSKVITATFTTAANFAGTSVTNTAAVSSSTTPDPASANNSTTITTPFGAASADLSIVKTGPTSAATGSSVTYTITVTNNGPAAATTVVVADPTPAGLSLSTTSGNCPSAFPCALGSLASGQSATILAIYTVTATSGSTTNTATVISPADNNSANDSSSATTQIGTNTCGQQPPTLLTPANGTTISSPVAFTWTAVSGATGYKLFASVGGAATQEIGSTTGTSLTLPVGGGSVVWSVQALGITNCSQLVSANGTFNVCDTGTTPVLSVVGTSSAGQSYDVQWSSVPGATFELQEASSDTFANAQTFPVNTTSKSFTKNAATPTAFFYRVRSVSACGNGSYSASERVVIVPIISSQTPTATVDINNKHVVVLSVFIPGQGTSLPYTASTDEPWLTVSPASGVLPAAGTTLSVSADPADLPNGTFTATIILTFPNASKTGALDAKPAVNVPVSVSVVTPVSPGNLSTPPANALIIPSVGHLDGINSQWRSDVRITNTASQKINYLLRFTPAGGDPTQIKQTQVTIASNDTMALDDIVKNWYGVGALGDAANGVLEVRPLNTSGKGAPAVDDVNVSFATVASSRTFNQSSGGTLGQYIPAIPFASFVGKVTGDARNGILSMQQIAQSPAYRTNLGIVEAAGKPASVLVNVFDTSGKNLLSFPLNLKAGEQQQLNSFLAAKNITLADGRVEVSVTSGEGKVTAYASVVDNKTTDPLLVNAVPLVQTAARSFVLPGVADLTNDVAKWRTDMRIFNSGADPQYVTMTLYPLAGGSGGTLTQSMTIQAGEVAVLDNVLASRFGVSNVGGAMHVDTLSDANLVVTGRTYNQLDGGGTYGQFIAAVTPADAAGKGGRTLNVLQVEDSTRYRTNLGISEISGKPVTVEVSVILPDAKAAPKVTIPLAANEYRQFRVLQQLGVGTAYNARISIRVIDGDGKIAAYGSVIDMQTQDPTYVPAQ